MALRLTTSPYREQRPGPCRGALPPLPPGWSLRLASPRWTLIWRAETEALARLRIAVLPDRWPPGKRAEFWTLLADQLHRTGAAPEAPDPRLLTHAVTILGSELAPAWRNPRLEEGDDHFEP